MTTYTLSKTSPTNTALIDPSGTTVYEVTTPFKLQDRSTTITREGQTVATIHWKVIGKSTFTIGDRTSTIDAAFPRTKALSLSRIYTSDTGHKFKWKAGSKLYCISEETGLNLATYYRNPFYLITAKKSTLDISASGAPFADELILTWVIMEKKARDRRRAARNGGGGGGGGDGG
ncbi:hypothetical protein RhiJN_19687 [Ceratobasidium sp. AG-Ba]|nr:hypothetical protein RhiJN_04857 [Ceratobasidium sp. AG-Ba]QRV91669.1 hypothetical protein RhiJN_19687 [Ceratobasidium sp. AG-Ba]